MPRRRPPRDGHVVNNLFLFAAVILCIPWLVEAQQQRRQAVVRQHKESPHEVLEQNPSHKLDATKIPHSVETPATYYRRKNTNIPNDFNKNDASAITTLAPAEESAVAAPPPRRPSVTAGLSSPHSARNIGDWEVEDFVLLATVDGKLHARDRKTGTERWELSYEQPMVQTKYRPRNRSLHGLGTTDIDDYLWIVEPSRDGTLYIYRPTGPNPGLVNTGLTMKKLVEDMSPHGGEDPPVMYTGEKKTNLMTIDANTGQVLSWFGTGGSVINTNAETCNVDDEAYETGDERCPKTSTLTVGRTEYTVGIQGRQDGHHIATLTFSEWSLNNYDADLSRQYSQSRTTLDNKYIYSGHDGAIIGFDHERSSRMDPTGLMFNAKFSSPVVRVFDVARPWGTDKTAPELILLPQPPPPNTDTRESLELRSNSIFLNHTEDGSWYAMSGKSYPLALGSIRPAPCSNEEWISRNPRWDKLNSTQLSEALVGLHSIETTRADATDSNFLTIGDSKNDALLDNETRNTSYDDSIPVLADDPTFISKLQLIFIIMQTYLFELVKNPLVGVILLTVIISYQRQIRTAVGRYFAPKNVKSSRTMESRVAAKVDVLPEIPEDEVIQIPAIDGANDAVTSKIEGAPVPPLTDGEKDLDRAKVDTPSQEKDSNPEKESSPEEEAPQEKKKKGAHRGQRGGKRHKKKRASSQDGQDGSSQQAKKPITVEEAVEEAKGMGQQTKLEPDIQTIPSDPQEVSGPVIRIGALKVNTDKLIGTGSNGTMVFEGNFDGREVAVKRMLIQFFDIASQETKLLRESDDHPNVIRYFAQQQAAGFLYIALELCPASLADVIDKPQNHRDLAQAGEKDLPNVLYQITNGLQHLHKLRIVHRDLKPQNILVAMGKDAKPRLLVSDFGLCKKLEGEQSSFRATTAHAAGTSGWRAPELLLDDDAKDGHNHSAMVDASTDGNSGSIVLGAELLPNRRATRAIDIFSLGLVFFYVLTKGSHPFDCGDRFMREVNIRKGTYNLRQLEVLGDYAFEAKDLIASMLSAEPKQRPQAHQVMAHPFFWSPKKRLNFLCDVSDHFEKEKRDPPTAALQELESYASTVCGSDFLKPLGKEFVDSLGKQRKYTGTRLLDLLRALRNKKNHYEDMSDKLKKDVGPLPDGYLNFWSRRFPNLLITCWNVVYEVQWEETDRFREYYLPAGL